MTMLMIDIPDAETRGVTGEKLAEVVRQAVADLGGARVGGIWRVVDAGPAGPGARVLKMLRGENRTYKVTYEVTVPVDAVRRRPHARRFEIDCDYLAAAERLINAGQMRVLGEMLTGQESTVIDFSYVRTPAAEPAEVA